MGRQRQENLKKITEEFEDMLPPPLHINESKTEKDLEISTMKKLAYTFEDLSQKYKGTKKYKIRCKMF